MNEFDYEALMDDIKMCYRFKFQDDEAIFERILELEQISLEKNDIEDDLHRLSASYEMIRNQLEELESYLELNNIMIPGKLPF